MQILILGSLSLARGSGSGSGRPKTYGGPGSLVHLHHSSKIKKSLRSHKTVEIKIFLSFFLLVGERIRIRTKKLRIRIQEAQKHTDPMDPEHWFLPETKCYHFTNLSSWPPHSS
jgi:hypothetical protein